MSKLHKYAFSDLYDISSGISSTKEQAGHGAPFVSFSTVFDNYFLPDELPDLMDTSAVDQEKCSVKKGDILITRTSENVDELAMSCVVLKDHPKATFSGFVKRLRPKTTGIAYDKYMAFFLRNEYFRKVINAKTIMTLRASFNEDIFSFLDLYLPDYEEQVRIGDFLYNIEKKIQCNKKINDNLQRQLKLLYDYWFTQFDFPDENGKPYRSSGGAMVWNEQLKHSIPLGWKAEKLCDVFDITMGSSPIGESLNENQNGIEFYQGSTDFGDIYPTERVYTTSPVRYAKAQDILLSVRAPVGAINISMNDCCIGRGLAAVHHKSTVYAWCTISTLQPYFDIFNANGTTFGALTSDDLKNRYIVSADNQVLQKFIEFSKPLENILRISSKETRELISLRDWLLPMLMNGQATISD